MKLLKKLVAVPVVAAFLTLDLVANLVEQLFEDGQRFYNWCHDQWDL